MLIFFVIFFVMIVFFFFLLFLFFFFNDTATTEIYTLSLHDALSISRSLPDWTLKVCWQVLSMWRATAMYSPSASTTDGKAPVDSRIKSPPGVTTDHCVLAIASPPDALTRRSVTCAARWCTVASV